MLSPTAKIFLHGYYFYLEEFECSPSEYVEMAGYELRQPVQYTASGTFRAPRTDEPVMSFAIQAIGGSWDDACQAFNRKVDSAVSQEGKRLNHINRELMRD